MKEDQSSVCLKHPELAINLICAAKRLLRSIDSYGHHQYGAQMRDLQNAINDAEGNCL